MSHNYTNYSKPGFTPVESKEIPEDAAPEQIEVMQLETVEPEELAQPALTIEEVGEAAVEEESAKPEPKSGVVTANKLNIRKLPSQGAEAIAVIKQGDTVQIETEASTAEWYKVYTSAGLEGYCMKKFIEVK